VTATDSQGRQVSQTYSVSFTAGLSIVTTTLVNGSVGHSYFQQLIVSGGGVNSKTFSAPNLPPGLGITSTGIISGTPSSPGTFPFSVTVSDGVSSASASFTIKIDGLPSITTGSPLPLGTVGATYKLSFSATGGVTPYTFFLLAPASPPPGLTLATDGTLSGVPTAPGLFPLTIQVIDGNRNSANSSFQLTISPGSQPLTVSPSSVQFKAPVGGDTPGSQDILVTSNGVVPLPFVVQVDDGNGGPAPDFVVVSPTSGTTPGSVRITTVPGSRPAGTLGARVRINLAGSGSSLADVPVALTLSPASPKLTVQPTVLRFVGHQATPSTSSQTFVLRNPGGGGAIPFSMTSGGSPWIKSLTASGPAIQPNAPATVSVTVNTQGLKAGAYRDAIHISSAAGDLDVPVTLFVAATGPFLSDSIDGVRFAARAGNTTSRSQSVAVSNLGETGTAVNWTAQVIRGADVVVLNNASGVSTTSSPSSFSVSLSAAAIGTPGSKFALIQVSDPNAENSPEYFSVVADVAAGTAAPLPDPDPAGLAFFASAGGAVTAAQQITVNTTTTDPAAFSVAAAADGGGTWLSASTSSSNTSLANPAKIAVSVDPSKLSPGVYTGLVNIAIAKALRSVNIIAIVKPAGSVTISESAQPESTRDATCVASKVAFVETALPSNFSVPAGWPASLAVQVADDCGNSLSSASVIASFSNGDPPLSLTGDFQTGAYSATWQPGNPLPQMTVTLDATSGTLAAARAQIAGNVDPNATPAPSLVIDGLLHNLNPQVGGALAPGTVTQIYGDNLAASPDTPQTVPLPTIYKGVAVLVGGRSAPIYYISKTQLTVQVPAELSANHTYPAILVASDQFSLPQNIDLIPVAPGTVAYPDGTLVAQHTDFTLVDQAHPAKPGETLVIYLVGMGSTTPSVPSGNAAPKDPLATVGTTPQVTIDGQPAEVGFAGQTPGGVGLYQINLKVPTGLRGGNLDVVITQGGVTANVTKLIVGQ
jgi:uncharacterized protein (TIGR03437 family)